MQHAIDCVNQYIQNINAMSIREREKAWTDAFNSDWENGGTKCYQWCKGESNERADMISRPDGSLTCDSKEMDTLIRDTWLPIFRMYDSCAKPSWATFKERFGQHFAPRHDMRVENLNGAGLKP